MSNGIAQSLVGKIVKVDRGGPESRIGLVLAVKKDYVALLTQGDGIVFYQPQHIKSITQHGIKDFPFKTNYLNQFAFIPPNDFKSTLRSLLNFHVKVNRGGPESVEGVLKEVWSDYIVLVVNDEVVRISIFHIRNISYKQVKNHGKSEGNNKQESNSKSESSSSSSIGPRRHRRIRVRRR